MAAKQAPKLTGRDYIAKVRLSDNDNQTLADPGETCERVPDTALPWLAKQELIERKGDDE